MILSESLEYETELVCDFAEYYHIYDIYALDCGLAATLAAGLRQDSRVKSKLLGLKAPLSTVLIAAAVDRLSRLIWKDPKLIMDAFLMQEETAETVKGFDTVEEFQAFRANIVIKRG